MLKVSGYVLVEVCDLLTGILGRRVGWLVQLQGTARLYCSSPVCRPRGICFGYLGDHLSAQASGRRVCFIMFLSLNSCLMRSWGRHVHTADKR